MRYKTILVHLNDERRAGQVIDAAAHLADRHEANLIGIYVVPSDIVGSPTALGRRIIGTGRQAFRDEAARIAKIFQTATAGRAIVPEWRVIDPARHHPGCAEAVIELSRSTDLIVAAQADPNWDYTLLLDFPERLAIESGRPTLIIPHAGRFPSFGKRVVLAWNGKKEAARAAFDALPLLKQAAAVRVLYVGTGGPSEVTDIARGSEIAAALARHGVKCETAQSVSGDIDVGNDLLSRLADFGADLLVMGCYGHSRFREFVFGGATREILEHMTVPVLMSH